MGNYPLGLNRAVTFALPNNINTAKIIGSLRLLYQCWISGAAFSGSNEVQLSQDSWKSILNKLDLPLSYTFDLANRKHVPTRIVLGNKESNHKISQLLNISPRGKTLILVP